MAEVIAVHGIWNHQAGRTPDEAAEGLGAAWSDELRAGYHDAGLGHLKAPRIAAVYYAHLLRDQAAQTGLVDPDELNAAECELLMQWARAHGMPSEVAQGTPTAIFEPALNWVLRNAGRPADKAGVLAARALREVRRYLGQKDRREAVQATVREQLTRHAPTAIIGHSLGSVVAYEVLWQKPYPEVDLFVTLGSPLALPGGVFDRLEHGGLTLRGAKPPGVKRWVNLAEAGDLIAVPRPLSERFDGVDTDAVVPMAPVDCHTMGMYLSSGMVAAAIAPHLSQGTDDFPKAVEPQG